MQRFGMTVPFDGQQLHEQRDRFERLERLGYTDLWTAEAMGADGLTPLTLGAVWTPSMRLGTAILPAYTRGPALLAQSVAGLASAAPGRFVLGIGSSSNVIVERWNGIPFEKPFQQTRDMVRFLKAALGGEKVTETYDTFDIKGFRLGLVPEQPSDDLGEHWEQWAAGDRKGALEKIPDDVIDELIIHGSPDDCRAHIQRYIDNGVTCPALSILPFPGVEIDEAIEGLAP